MLVSTILFFKLDIDLLLPLNSNSRLYHWLAQLSDVLDWDYTMGSPGSPACWLQIMGFLSLHSTWTNSLLYICIVVYVYQCAYICICYMSTKWVRWKWKWSCPTVCDPVDYTVHGILQSRTLERVAVPFSRGSSQPRDPTQVSCIAGRFCTSWATREAQEHWSG